VIKFPLDTFEVLAGFECLQLFPRAFQSGPEQQKRATLTKLFEMSQCFIHKNNRKLKSPDNSGVSFLEGVAGAGAGPAKIV